MLLETLRDDSLKNTRLVSSIPSSRRATWSACGPTIETMLKYHSIHPYYVPPALLAQVPTYHVHANKTQDIISTRKFAFLSFHNVS